METISVYEAIATMRKITAQAGSFSFVHATLDRPSKTSNGLRVVRNARLRPAATSEEVENADHKLFYTDLDDNAPRVAWQPLLMYFEGLKTTLE